MRTIHQTTLSLGPATQIVVNLGKSAPKILREDQASPRPVFGVAGDQAPLLAPSSPIFIDSLMRGSETPLVLSERLSLGRDGATLFEDLNGGQIACPVKHEGPHLAVPSNGSVLFFQSGRSTPQFSDVISFDKKRGLFFRPFKENRYTYREYYLTPQADACHGDLLSTSLNGVKIYFSRKEKARFFAVTENQGYGILRARNLSTQAPLEIGFLSKRTVLAGSFSSESISSLTTHLPQKNHPFLLATGPQSPERITPEIIRLAKAEARGEREGRDATNFLFYLLQNIIYSEIKKLYQRKIRSQFPQANQLEDLKELDQEFFLLFARNIIKAFKPERFPDAVVWKGFTKYALGSIRTVIDRMVKKKYRKAREKPFLDIGVPDYLPFSASLDPRSASIRTLNPAAGEALARAWNDLSEKQRIYVAKRFGIAGEDPLPSYAAIGKSLDPPVTYEAVRQGVENALTIFRKALKTHQLSRRVDHLLR